MQQLKEILPQVLLRFRHVREFKLQAVAWHWRDIVGDEIVRHARPVKLLQGGVLVVAVNSPVWAHHLSTMAEELTAKINTYFQGRVIMSLRFQAGYWPDRPNQENRASAVAEAPEPLTPQEERQAEELAAAADDAAVRQAAAGAIRQYYRWRKRCLRLRWHHCAVCHALCAPTEHLCPVCAREQRRALEEKVRQWLLEMPWASYREAAPYLACDAATFDRIKRRLQEDLLLRLITGRGTAEQRDVLLLTMLKTGCRPADITEDIIQQALGHNICKILAGRHKEHVPARRRGHGGTTERHYRHCRQ